MFEMVTAGCKPFFDQAKEDDKVYKYIQLDRDDLFYAILVHEEIYKNHKSLSKGVKTLISFMISFLPHERPSAAEVLNFIGKIQEENEYDVTDDDLKKELSWRIKHNQTI
jgi:hypothetical protein